MLKERLFDLTGNQSNHGEDVAEYPYALAAENQRRRREGMEYELLDTGVFDDNRYFDVGVEYAKAEPELI